MTGYYRLVIICFNFFWSLKTPSVCLQASDPHTFPFHRVSRSFPDCPGRQNPGESTPPPPCNQGQSVLPAHPGPAPPSLWLGPGNPVGGHCYGNRTRPWLYLIKFQAEAKTIEKLKGEKCIPDVYFLFLISQCLDETALREGRGGCRDVEGEWGRGG